MGIFDSMENMFEKEQVRETAEPNDVLPAQEKPTMDALQQEYSAFGDSARFRGMLDKAGISREAFRVSFGKSNDVRYAENRLARAIARGDSSVAIKNREKELAEEIAAEAARKAR